MKISDELKLNDKVLVTLINKGEFTYLTNGTKTKFKVSYKGLYGFNLKQSGYTSLTHFNSWETSYGIFEIDRGMVIKIEKRITPIERFFRLF